MPYKPPSAITGLLDDILAALGGGSWTPPTTIMNEDVDGGSDSLVYDVQSRKEVTIMVSRGGPSIEPIQVRVKWGTDEGDLSTFYPEVTLDSEAFGSELLAPRTFNLFVTAAQPDFVFTLPTKARFMYVQVETAGPGEVVDVVLKAWSR